MKYKALIVVTGHNQLGDTGEETGWHLAEVSHVYWPLINAGFAVEFASPSGGEALIDQESIKLDDPENKSFIDRLKIANSLKTMALREVNPDQYQVIYFAGGHGTMWDFPDNPNIDEITRSIYEKGGIVAAVCHGPSALTSVKLTDGEYLIKDKKINSFTDEEERAVGKENVVPFLLETRLRERGAIFEGGSNFSEKVVTDDRLITGQNPQSASALGREIVKKWNQIELSSGRQSDTDSLHWVVQT